MVHAGGDRGMRELEQDGAAPAGNDDHLAVDLPGDAVGPGPHVVRSEQARAHRRAMALQCIAGRARRNREGHVPESLHAVGAGVQ